MSLTLTKIFDKIKFTKFSINLRNILQSQLPNWNIYIIDNQIEKVLQSQEPL